MDIDWAKLYGDRPPAASACLLIRLRKNASGISSLYKASAPVNAPADENDPAEQFEVMTFREVLKEQALPAAGEKQVKTVISFLSDQKKQQEAVSVVKSYDSDIDVIFIAQGDRHEALSA